MFHTVIDTTCDSCAVQPRQVCKQLQGLVKEEKKQGKTTYMHIQMLLVTRNS